MGTVGGEKRTPMAWQHRDMNYHQSAYPDKYGAGPPSMSDRLSHRTDKSWRTQRDSQYNAGAPVAGYSGGAPPATGYPPSRPSYSSGRPASRPHSPESSSTSSSSSSSEAETDQEAIRNQMGHMLPPQPVYGYGGYYPGYHPSQAGYPPSMSQGYPGTLKSAKSVPAIALNTWDGEPCPVHGAGPMSLQAPQMMGPPGSMMGPPGSMMGPPGSMMGPPGSMMGPPGSMMGPPGSMMGPPGSMMMPPNGPMSMPSQMPPRRAASIYDMRMLSPPPAQIYGTLPIRPMGIPGDRRSIAGAPPGIPPQLLPPMVRPRPVVLSEGGLAEPLPVRAPTEKSGGLPMSRKMGANGGVEKKRICSKGGVRVAYVIMGVVACGLVLGLLLVFIL